MNIRDIQRKRENKLFLNLPPSKKLEIAIELSEFVQELQSTVKKEYERRIKRTHKIAGRSKIS